MASPNCGKCGSTSFQLSLVSPLGANYQLSAVHCAKCGAVLGVTEYLNAGIVLHKHGAALKRIAKALNTIVDVD